MKIKLASIVDADHIFVFINHHLKHPPMRRVILDRISKGEEFIAIEGDKIVGVLTLSNENLSYIGIKWEIIDDSPVYIDSLIVDKNFGEEKLKEELLTFAEMKARKKGARSIRLDDISVGSTPAEFYLKLGFSKWDKNNPEKFGSKIYVYEKKL